MLILITPQVLGWTQVEYSLDNVTWKNTTSTNNNLTIIEKLENGLDENTEYYFRLKNHYTNGASEWTYITTRTETSGEIPMSSLAIIGFVTLITIAVFILPNRVGRFSEYDHIDSLLKGLIYSFGLFLLSLITAMVGTVSETFSVGVTQEIFTFLFLIQWAAYFSILFVIILFTKRVITQWGQHIDNKRMGYDETDTHDKSSQ